MRLSLAWWSSTCDSTEPKFRTASGLGSSPSTDARMCSYAAPSRSSATTLLGRYQEPKRQPRVWK
jgi:hypothetical protein